MGVAQMCGREVVLAPVTYDDFEIETFFRRVKELGAYESEGFYS